MEHHTVFTDETFRALLAVGKRMADLALIYDKEPMSYAARMSVQAEELSKALKAGRVVYGLEEAMEDFQTCADIDCKALYPRESHEGNPDLCPAHAEYEAREAGPEDEDLEEDDPDVDDDEPIEADMSGPDGPVADSADGYKMSQADVEAEAT